MAERQDVTPAEIREEQRRLRYLRTLVDLAANVIMQGRFARSEARKLVEATRRQILQLFPGEEQTYNLIYRPRFERLILEYTTSEATASSLGDDQTRL